LANFITRREEKQILLPQGGIRMTCHAEPVRFAQGELREASRHFSALFELTNAGILLPQGGIRMTGGGVFLYE
jgi:hypothetical protein